MWLPMRQAGRCKAGFTTTPVIPMAVEANLAVHLLFAWHRGRVSVTHVEGSLKVSVCPVPPPMRGFLLHHEGLPYHVFRTEVTVS